MKTWYVNETNTITVVWYGLNPDLVVEYKIPTGEWIAIGVPADIGDNIHIIDHAFADLGTYIIRIKDINTGFDMVSTLSVVVNTAESVCGCVETSTNAMTTKIDTLDEGLRQVLRQVTDEVNENQTVIEKTGFVVTI
jgi:hypothetical protein